MVDFDVMFLVLMMIGYIFVGCVCLVIWKFYVKKIDGVVKSLDLMDFVIESL